MHALASLVRWVTVGAGTLILCLMLVQVVVDVFLRALAGAGVPATADVVARYYMVAVSFLPLAYTELKRRHIEASIFTERLAGRPRQAVHLLGFVLSLGVYGLLVYGTGAEALSQTRRGSYVMTGVAQFVTWPSYWILPIAFGLMALVLLLRTLEVLTGRFTDTGGDPLAELRSGERERR